MTMYYGNGYPTKGQNTKPKNDKTEHGMEKSEKTKSNWKQISEKRTKNQAKTDKTEHGIEKRGKYKVKLKPKSTKVKVNREKSKVKSKAVTEEYLIHKPHLPPKQPHILFIVSPASFTLHHPTKLSLSITPYPTWALANLAILENPIGPRNEGTRLMGLGTKKELKAKIALDISLTEKTQQTYLKSSRH
ncbi:hypothetical protein Tco_1348198 [Tanacetum coccineum]